MLTSLDIHGLAIIDALSIEFDDGFNVITGETGAGKSILIKALGLLLGAKASAEAVRAGVDVATVSGAFDIPDSHPSLGLLDERDIPVERDGDGATLLVRRSVNSKGRSKAWINDIPITVATLRDFGAALIDIFGQHENQRLLDPSQHTGYVDQFLAKRDTLDAVRARFSECTDALRDLARTAEDFRARRRDADYLTYRSDELDTFDPSREDFERVSDLCRNAGGAMRTREKLAEAQALLDEGAGGDPVSQPVWQVARALGNLADAGSPSARELSEEAADLASRLDDLSFRVGSEATGLDVDESELTAAQERLAGYQDLVRRFAVSDVDGLVEERERLRGELDFLESASAEAREIADRLADRARSLQASAKKLTTARKKAVASLVKKIETELHELAMPGAELDVVLEPVERNVAELDLDLFGDDVTKLHAEATAILATTGEHGAESAVIRLASNAGEPAHPIHKIASGGEISRIMLAIKKGLAAGADTCILVFDEIDTGISGRVADVVGRKMRELGQGFQVLCISHLAQVAAHGDTHFQVEKLGKAGRTETTIRRLTKKESEEAIARLLSGKEVSKTSLANARTLIAKARA